MINRRSFYAGFYIIMLPICYFSLLFSEGLVSSDIVMAKLRKGFSMEFLGKFNNTFKKSFLCLSTFELFRSENFGCDNV